MGRRELSLGLFTFDLALDPEGDPGVGRLERMVGLAAIGVVLDPPDLLLAPLEN